MALMGAPKHSMNAVVSGTFTVQSHDDHSDVVRLCLRPAWLRMAWASPRDFCLARCVYFCNGRKRCFNLYAPETGQFVDVGCQCDLELFFWRSCFAIIGVLKDLSVFERRECS